MSMVRAATDSVSAAGTAVPPPAGPPQPAGPPPPNGPPQPQPLPSGPALSRPWAIFALLAAAQFMVVLDTSIVYLALPSIQTDLGFGAGDLAWVLNVYMLSFGGFMLLFGRAADLMGRRRVLVAGLLLFLAASTACALAASANQLVAARTLQGLGAAVISPAALALVTDLFPEGPARHKAFGIWGGMGGLAGAAGTLIGGVLTEASWRWTFWINVPVTLLVLAFGLRMLPRTGPVARGRVDLVGAAASTAGVCLLLYAVLNAGTGQGGVRVWGALAGSVVLMAGFVLRERTAEAPLIPLPLFGLRNVVLGNVANMVVGALLFGIFLLVTLHLQVLRDFSPLRAGLATMPISVAVFLGSQLTIRLLSRVTPVAALSAGLAVQAGALGWWAAVLDPADRALTSYLLPGMLWGLSLGVSIVAAFVICTAGVHGPMAGAASGLVSCTLQVGGAIGVAILTAVTTWQAGDAVDLAVGQPRALWVASGLAVLGLPFLRWLHRSTRRRPRHRRGRPPRRRHRASISPVEGSAP